MPVAFHKMHGAGNDFMLVDLRYQPFQPDPDTVRALADRRTGIGFDQLLTLHEPRDAAHRVRFEVWNADGSRAEQCGNGVRCIALHLQRCGEVSTDPFEIGGPVARIGVQVLGADSVRVDMGVPDFEPQRIPFLAVPVNGKYPLQVDDLTLQVGAVSMGNPHALFEVDDLYAAEIEVLGPAISRHVTFPRGCNAGFARVVTRREVDLRVFERGAGETRACGSGACAAAAILMEWGRLERNAKIRQKGGDIVIEWPHKDVPLLMTGPAAHVYEGQLK